MSGYERYVKGQTPSFRLSQSDIEGFRRCPRCFFLDVKHGISQQPSAPLTLHLAVAAQLKKEIDGFWLAGAVPPVVAEAGLDLRQFSDPAMDAWCKRTEGISFDTGVFKVTGVIHDVWVNRDGELIVVEYKATSRDNAVAGYRYARFDDSYRREVEIHQWLLRKNGFKVSNTAYFLYATATQQDEFFENSLSFESNLNAYEGSTDWIDEALEQIKLTLDNPEVPESLNECEVCTFAMNRTLVLAILGQTDEIPPTCPVCKGVMSQAIYGMPMGPPPTGFVTMGCMREMNAPDWLCENCKVDDDDYEDAA